MPGARQGAALVAEGEVRVTGTAVKPKEKDH